MGYKWGGGGGWEMVTKTETRLWIEGEGDRKFRHALHVEEIVYPIYLAVLSFNRNMLLQDNGIYKRQINIGCRVCV
jgi:hypothetical protein